MTFFTIFSINGMELFFIIYFYFSFHFRQNGRLTMRIRNRYNRVRVRKRSAMLDKPIPRQPPDEWMSKNTKKIRREVKLNGASVWITADSEQEYAEKLLKLSDRPSKEPVSPKHPFRAYAERWYNVFSKPNVCSTTALTYRRQLDYHIYPVIADKYVEDLTVDDVQTIFNRMGSETKTETKNKVKIVLNQILRLAVEEAVTNVIHHAHASCIHLESEVRDGMLHVTLTDDGRPFDPTLAPDVDTSVPADKRVEGGLGILFMRHMSEALSYHREAGNNVLTIKKEIRKDEHTE